MQDIIRRSLPAALATALVAGAFALPAIATTDDDAGEDTTTQATGEGTDGRRGRHHLGHGLEDGDLAERLAAELDLDVDTVQDALDAVRSDLAAERLATAVEDGRLTQEQADRITAAVEAGDDEALQEVRDEIRLEHLAARLEEQVAAGELTQEEADEILAAAEDGDFPRRRGRRGHGPRGGPNGPTDAEADNASA